jgi:molecular chaperone HscB
VEDRATDRLDGLLRDLRQERRERLEALGALLDAGSNEAAGAAARQLMFIEKIEHDASEAIDRLEN